MKVILEIEVPDPVRDAHAYAPSYQGGFRWLMIAESIRCQLLMGFYDWAARKVTVKVAHVDPVEPINDGRAQ